MKPINGLLSSLLMTLSPFIAKWFYEWLDKNFDVWTLNNLLMYKWLFVASALLSTLLGVALSVYIFPKIAVDFSNKTTLKVFSCFLLICFLVGFGIITAYKLIVGV